jgi:hypothetical protein
MSSLRHLPWPILSDGATLDRVVQLSFEPTRRTCHAGTYRVGEVRRCRRAPTLGIQINDGTVHCPSVPMRAGLRAVERPLSVADLS